MEREARASARRMDKAQNAVKELDFNKELNEQLMRNQQELQAQLAAAAKREAELRESLADQEQMLKDMTFHFEAQIKILQEGGGSSELEGGGLITQQAEEPGAKMRGKRKAKKG